MSRAPDASPAAYARPKPASAARSGRRRRAAPGDLRALLREVWHALLRVGDLLDDPDATGADLVRAGHAVAGLANAYRASIETADLDRRIAALEAAVTAQERDS